METKDAISTRPLNDGESLANETAPSENDGQSELLSPLASSEQEMMDQEIPLLIGEIYKLPSSQLAQDTAAPSSKELINPKTYEDYSWSRLPLEVQEAAVRLGYTKTMWDEDQEPESSNKDWEQLDLEEQEAAKVLGYDETDWNSEDTEMVPKDYDSFSWKELPMRIQEAYGILGYDEDLWDRDKSPATVDKAWDELRRKEQRAAKLIGYTEKTWNEDDSDEKDQLEPQDEPAPLLEEAVSNFGDKELKPKDYDDMFWNQLPKKIKEAYEALGYDEDLWDRDEAPAAVGKDWDDLTEEEQNGAVTVGYSEATWDADSDDEDDDLEPKRELTGFKGKAVEFLTGSSYVLLDCMSTAAFFGVIESVFMIGKLFLDGKVINVLKIVIGLAIMQFNGQLRKGLGADKETKKARSRKKREDMTLFHSSLNLFSWWTTFNGVNHFFYSFEKDFLFKRAEEWFQDLYEMAEKAFEEELKSGSETGNMTCTYIQNFDFNRTIQGYLLGKACALSENNWEPMGHFYYILAFVVSALPMWFLFGDNFLKGCDV